MLMDEPFGAIDPINRERLQNEFLRLQERVRKTIVFVTHDIDEAIKMGDRIAILQQRRRARAVRDRRRSCSCIRPNEFVATSSAPTARSSASRCMRVARRRTSGRRRRSPTSSSCDADRRRQAWRDPQGGQSTPVLTVDRDDILRDALSDSC